MSKLWISQPGCIIACTLMLCLAGFVPCQAQVGLQVSPVKLYFNPKGGERTQRVQITNLTDTELVLQTSCADWRRDSTGNKVYALAGSSPTSCCGLVKMTPSTVRLAPKEVREVLVTLVADPTLKLPDLRNGMLFLTQTNEREVAALKGASQFIVKAQVGIHLYVLPDENPQPDIAIMSMGVVQEKHQVQVGIQNTGGALLESQLRMEYLNLETMEEVKADPIPVNTMPHDAFKVSADIPTRLSRGKYLIVAILDSGPSQALKVAELETVLR